MLWKAVPPVNLSVVTCDSCRGMTSKMVPGSITVCSTGPSVARGVKITRPCRPPPLRAGDGRRRLAALSGLPHPATRGQFFWLVLYVFVIKWSPHICANIAICAETGIGITCGSHWSTHETAHEKPLPNTHWSYIGLILSNPWNSPYQAIVLPHIGTTKDLYWSPQETTPVRKAIFCHTFALHRFYIDRPMKLPT